MQKNNLLDSPATAGKIAMRAEVELLLCCARTHVDAPNAHRIERLLQSNIDWPHLTALAWRQGVLPLLYWNLNKVCPEAVPRSALAQLRQQFLINTRKNLFWTSELLKLLDLLEAHDIVAIPYKGPVLIASLYDNLALRQLSDLDILVRRQDVVWARELLVSQGYRQVNCPDEEDASYLDTGYHYQFIREDGRVYLELHWAFAPKKFFFPLHLETVWHRTRSVTLAERQIPGLCREDMLIVHCAHLAAHCWRGTERLKWVCDVAELVSAYSDLDWDWTLAEADNVGGKRMLFLGLWLAHDLLGATLPDVVQSRVCADGNAQDLAKQVRRRLVTEEISPLEGRDRHAFFLQMKERGREKVRYLVHRARYRMRPNARDRELLPASLSFLGYLIRPLRLAGKLAYHQLRRILYSDSHLYE